MLSQKQPPVRMRPLGFHPPRFALDAELEWVLQRALGPLTWRPKATIVGQNPVDVALRLDLAARIAARHPQPLLERELGRGPAQRLREQHVAAVGREALLEHALTQLLKHAAEFGVPCILLKYAALNRMGVLRVGARVASDIDVLVPQDDARRLQRFLKQRNYQDLGLPESSHQLPALHDPNGVLIELHVHVPLITLSPGLPFARADDLLTSGLTVESGGAFLPVPAIVTAHAVAHGLMQHSHVPQVYSPLKTFADLADLEAASPGVLAQAGAYLSAMTPEDWRSVQTLARALSSGELDAAMADGAGLILRHALASQLDRRYALALRLLGFARSKPTSVHRTPAQLWTAARAAWHWVRNNPPNRS